MLNLRRSITCYSHQKVLLCYICSVLSYSTYNDSIFMLRLLRSMYSKKEGEVRRFSFLLDILCCVAVLCGEGGDVAEEPPLYCYIQVHDSPTIIGS